MKLHQAEVRRIVTFLVGGGLNTGVTWLAYLLLLTLMDYRVAYATSYVLGIVLSYLINSVLVFRVPVSLRNFLTYPAVYLAQFILTEVLLWVAVDGLAVPRTLAPVGAVALVLPVTYLLSRRLLSGPGSPGEATSVA